MENSNTERKTYVCRKLFLYNFLTKNHQEPFKVVPDKYDCHKTVWLYTWSQEIENLVTEYYSQKY